MPKLNRNNIALVTGASRGIGEAYAVELARRGYDLFLVARHEEDLKKVCDRIKKMTGRRAIPIVQDLLDEQAPHRIYEIVRNEHRKRPALLVNNAGIAASGLFEETELERHQRLLTLNIMRLTELTHIFLPDMVRAEHGRILNVASFLGLCPQAGVSTYAASKAYIVNFTRALNSELRGTGVSASAACPGYTNTKMVQGDRCNKDPNYGKVPARLLENRFVVARRTLDHLEKGIALSITTFGNRLTLLIMRLLGPVRFDRLLAKAFDRKAMEKHHRKTRKAATLLTGRTTQEK